MGTKSLNLLFVVTLVTFLQQGGIAALSNDKGQQEEHVVLSFSNNGDPFALEADSISRLKYLVFLRAATLQRDPHHLYSSELENQITCFWDQDHFDYELMTQVDGDVPITGLNEEQAMRYCNWIENGALTDYRAMVTTETGSYNLKQDNSWKADPEARCRLIKDEVGHFTIVERRESNPLMMFKTEEQKSPERHTGEITEQRGQQVPDEGMQRGDLLQGIVESEFDLETSYPPEVKDIVDVALKATKAADTANDIASNASDAEVGSLWNKVVNTRITAVTAWTDALNVLKNLKTRAGVEHSNNIQTWLEDQIQKAEEEIKRNQDSKFTAFDLVRQYESSLQTHQGKIIPQEIDFNQGNIDDCIASSQDQLTLAHFQSALEAYPEAERFVIVTHQNGGYSITPQEADPTDFDRNRGENIHIIDTLKTLIPSGVADDLLKGDDSPASSLIEPISAPRLREILARAGRTSTDRMKEDQQKQADKKTDQNDTKTASADDRGWRSGLKNGGNDCFINSSLQLWKTLELPPPVIMPNLTKFFNNDPQLDCKELRLEMANQVMAGCDEFDDPQPTEAKPNPAPNSRNVVKAIRKDGTAVYQSDASAFLLRLLEKVGAPKVAFTEILTNPNVAGESRVKQDEGTLFPLILPLAEEVDAPLTMQNIINRSLSSKVNVRWNDREASDISANQTRKFNNPAPPSLIVSIARFNEIGAKRQDVINGVLNTIKIPLLNEEEATYQPSAIICHIGEKEGEKNSETSGHYICYIKNGNKWWKFDDDKVTQATYEEDNENINKNCYLISYKITDEKSDIMDVITHRYRGEGKLSDLDSKSDRQMPIPRIDPSQEVALKQAPESPTIDQLEKVIGDCIKNIFQSHNEKYGSLTTEPYQKADRDWKSHADYSEKINAALSDKTIIGMTGDQLNLLDSKLGQVENFLKKIETASDTTTLNNFNTAVNEVTNMLKHVPAKTGLGRTIDQITRVTRDIVKEDERRISEGVMSVDQATETIRTNCSKLREFIGTLHLLGSGIESCMGSVIEDGIEYVFGTEEKNNSILAKLEERAKESEKNARMGTAIARKTAAESIYPELRSFDDSSWRKWAKELVQQGGDDECWITPLTQQAMLNPFWAAEAITTSWIEKILKQHPLPPETEALSSKINQELYEAQQSLNEANSRVIQAEQKAVKKKEMVDSAQAEYEQLSKQLEKLEAELNEPYKTYQPDSAQQSGTTKEFYLERLTQRENIKNDIKRYKKDLEKLLDEQKAAEKEARISEPVRKFVFRSKSETNIT